MTKTNKIRTLIGLAAAAGLLVAATANATTLNGRVAAFSATSITVADRELVTVGFDNNTVFTKLVTQKPWQEDTALTASALRVGAFVVVHVPENGGFVANWVQIALDRGWLKTEPAASTTTVYTYTDDALKHLAEAKARRANATASESKRPGGVDTAAHCERLAAMGRTAVQVPSVAAPAAPENNEAAKHRAEAAARRANPTASESKRPGGVDTAAHCERRAAELEKVGK